MKRTTILLLFSVFAAPFGAHEGGHDSRGVVALSPIPTSRF
jgi:hypothetical protein